jgi:hypothetical protein
VYRKLTTMLATGALVLGGLITAAPAQAATAPGTATAGATTDLTSTDGCNFQQRWAFPGGTIFNPGDCYETPAANRSRRRSRQPHRTGGRPGSVGPGGPSMVDILGFPIRDSVANSRVGTALASGPMHCGQERTLVKSVDILRQLGVPLVLCRTASSRPGRGSPIVGPVHRWVLRHRDPTCF